MERSDEEERKIVYTGLATYAKDPYVSDSFADLLKVLESEKKDGLVNIIIADREVGTLRIEAGRIYLNEIVDQTPQELGLLNKYPVYGRIAMKSLMEKYIDTVANDSIEDIAFINGIRNDPDNRKVDEQNFILLLWDRYWNVFLDSRVILKTEFT